MVSKNNLCPYSHKGLYGQIRIMGFAPGDSMNNFIKLNWTRSIPWGIGDFRFSKLSQEF